MNSWPALAEGHAWSDLEGGYYRPRLEALHAATLFCLFALYGFVLIRWRRFGLTPRAVALIGLAPALLSLVALPTDSTDILFYLAQGRLLVIHGANPYAHTAYEFPDDFSPYFGWNVPMPYGPVSLPPFMLAAWLSTTSVVLSILALKLIWLLVHVCSCAVLYGVLLRKRADAAYGLFLFGLSPLILVEQVGNGHNDGLMVLFGLLAIAAVQRGRPVAALPLALCAAFVKIPGAVFWVAILILLLRQGEWRRAAVGTVACAGLTVLMAVPFFGDPNAALAVANRGMWLKSTNSLHDLVIAFLTEYGPSFGGSIGLPEIFIADRWIAGVLLLAFSVWRATHIRTLESLVRELAYLFLAYLVGFTAWFHPWYVTWLVPLAALTAADRLRNAIVAYSGSTLALYAFPGYLLTQARFHQAWAAIRILVAHAPVLALVTRSIRAHTSGRAARRAARGLPASAGPGTE
jgi:alpha-1,6-mannosyltransferase